MNRNELRASEFLVEHAPAPPILISLVSTCLLRDHLLSIRVVLEFKACETLRVGYNVDDCESENLTSLLRVPEK